MPHNDDQEARFALPTPPEAHTARDVDVSAGSDASGYVPSPPPPRPSPGAGKLSCHLREGELFQEIGHGGLGLIKPVHRLGHTWRWCRGNPRLATLLALVVVSLL